MNIVRQEIYIARKAKNKELQVLLSKLVLASLSFESCICFEMYQSDDDINEFLVYSEFKDDKAMKEHIKLVQDKIFNNSFDELVLKKELLPNFD